MKYSIQPRSVEGFHAGTKAVKDVSKILNEENYNPFFVGSNYNGNHLYRLIILVYDLIRLYIKAKKDDVFFIQWPYYNYLMPVFYWVVKKRCRRIQLLAHDINSLRNGFHGSWDFDFFRLSEVIIVHSDTMKDYLKNNGIDNNKIWVLTSFDYLTNDKISVCRKNSAEIAYAGNLRKSTFLHKINTLDSCIKINCYGKKVSNLPSGLNYVCAFSPENVSVLEGAWGLVWDGESLDSCTGTFGDYLKYNAPHKLSLYIVAEMPVIIWKESALAEYVESKGIGILISSIYEIENRIHRISDEDYSQMIQNVRKESQVLRNGGHLRNILKGIK